MKNKKYFLLGLAILLLPIVSFAQGGDLNAAINTGTNQLKTIAGNIILIAQVIMGIGGIVCIILIFYKTAKGDQDASNKAQSFLWALVFAVIGTLVVKTLWL